jgi:hypothetical protein
MATMSTTTKAKPVYSVQFIFNGETLEEKCDAVDVAIQKVRPEQLHTDMFVTVKKGTAVMERHLNLTQGRMLFANPDFREIFINNLLLA